MIRPIGAASTILDAWSYGKTVDETYPIDSKTIAEGFGINVIGDQFEDDFVAMFRKTGNSKIIIFNENIREEGRKNFTIAHELGHFSLHLQRKDIFQCTFDDINDFGKNRHPNDIEREANKFAANLLMPTSDFIEQIEHRPPSLAVASELTNRYQTSLTATALRMVDMSRFACAAIIVTEKGVVKWAYPNSRMQKMGLPFLAGEKCSVFLGEHKNPIKVDAQKWVQHLKPNKTFLLQSSIPLPRYRETILFISSETPS